MAPTDEKPSGAKSQKGILKRVTYKAPKIDVKKAGALSIDRKSKPTGAADSAKEVAADSKPPPITKFAAQHKAYFPKERDKMPERKVCKPCKKHITDDSAKDHCAGCLKKKQDKARQKKEAREAAQREKERAARGDDDDDEDDDIRDGKGKKRKAGDADKDEEPKKKKKKDEPKAKAAKAKGPVDVEKQCGVLLPNGAQCARSLTCKSHSMGAKRAVPGRSLPYDMLLQNYQKKNQARQQKAAIDANAPLQDEDLDVALSGPVDSDEERDAIMAAVARSLANPQPLYVHPQIPKRRKYQLIRLKEQLHSAIQGNRSGNMFAVPKDIPATATVDQFAMPSSASSAVPTGGMMAQPAMKMPNRKQSVDPT
jgi:SAGA-associated factor 73